jgi:hypothetical protein
VQNCKKLDCHGRCAASQRREWAKSNKAQKFFAAAARPGIFSKMRPLF